MKELFLKKINQLVRYMQFVQNTIISKDYFYTSIKTDSGKIKEIDLLEEYKGLANSILNENNLALKNLGKNYLLYKKRSS